jgi:hypothetical protein
MTSDILIWRSAIAVSRPTTPWHVPLFLAYRREPISMFDIASQWSHGDVRRLGCDGEASDLILSR